MKAYWINSSQIRQKTYIPRYYNPSIEQKLSSLIQTHDCIPLVEFKSQNIISISSGHEIGKMAYGTGDIPFIRTSDLSNWEIKTAPKQGVSEEIYREYSGKQNVVEGDILFVKDGTYLIGTNALVTQYDLPLLYQSHLFNIRILDKQKINPYILFLIFNSDIFQKQIRSFQFTADIIDTIGDRLFDAILPIPKSLNIRKNLAESTKDALELRAKGKLIISQLPLLIEKTLRTGNISYLQNFIKHPSKTIEMNFARDTLASENGKFQAFWIFNNKIKDSILIPRYYAPDIEDELSELSNNCELITMAELRKLGVIQYETGIEIGKLAYGTGTIPFIRTSDFSNWEIKHDPKQGISEAIYDQYSKKAGVLTDDILLVRDGTYLVGSSCIVTKFDSQALFCGGLYRIRVINKSMITPYLLLALLNSYIVKRQIRTKQFTRDVIDTIGNRLDEVILPIPKKVKLKESISEIVANVINLRIESRSKISILSRKVTLD